MKSLNKYNRIVVFDTETTGFKPKQDKIVEFGALVFEDGGLKEEHNFLIDPGVPITNSHIHNITNEMCEKDGISYTALIAFLNEMFKFNDETLFVAFNIPFDIGFVLELLTNNQDINKLNMLDVMAVYKDRYPYSDVKDKNDKSLGHRLDSMVHHLKIEVKNDHRAVTDSTATMLGLMALSKVQDNLQLYVNKIGYNAKYGVSGIQFNHITYIAQSFYGNREIEMYTEEVKSYSGTVEYVVSCIGLSGDKRYWAADSRIDGLNKPTLFSRSLFKMLSEEEGNNIIKRVKQLYIASKKKENVTRANSMKLEKVNMEEL